VNSYNTRQYYLVFSRIDIITAVHWILKQTITEQAKEHTIKSLPSSLH